MDAVPLRRPRRAVHDHAHVRPRRARQVQDVPTGAVTYGHRFLTTSGRAGRAIKVRSFDEYRARLLENFVIARAQRAPQQDRARSWTPKRSGCRDASAAWRTATVGLLHDVPDLVEYPSVIAGTFAPEFLEPARRSADDDADPPSALLSGRGRRRQAEERVSRGHQHRARQRAHHRPQRRTRRHRAAARRAVLLGSRSEDRRSSRASIGWRRCCSTRSSGTTRTRPSGSSRLARVDRAGRARRRRSDREAFARDARRAWRRPISPPTWCASSRNCRAPWAASTRARRGQPEEVWKAIYYHYLPDGC